MIKGETLKSARTLIIDHWEANVPLFAQVLKTAG